MNWRYILSIYFIYILLSIIVKVIGEQNFPGNVLLYHAINSSQIGFLNPIMIFLSEYGREYVWIPTTAALFIAGGKYRRASIILASAFVLAIIFGELSKYAVAQPRPFLELSTYHLLVPKPHDFSYPSGHALIVGVGALTLLMTLPYYISIPLTVEALLVSYSRVYVGVHWPLDVIAGWILAASISLTAIKLEWLEMKIYDRVKGILVNGRNETRVKQMKKERRNQE